jgi:hypothetical protein
MSYKNKYNRTKSINKNRINFISFDRTGKNVDYYYPENYKDYEGVYEPTDFYVIRDYDLLKRQLDDIYSYCHDPNFPYLYWNNKLITMGTININTEQMITYMNKYKGFDIIYNGESNRYLPYCTEYIADLFNSCLMNATNYGGGILAYRFRYIFHPNLLFITGYDMRKLTWILYKDLMSHMIAYSFVPFVSTESCAVDFIVANGNKINTGKSKHTTLYHYMNNLPKVLNSDISDIMQLNINPKAKGNNVPLKIR